MIGEIRKVITPYYDLRCKRMKLKSRPALILKELNGDYVILPISRITHRENVDKEYDIFVTTANYSLLKLNNDSYIRTNKQTIVNHADVGDMISDLKVSYPELFDVIINKIEDFNMKMITTLREIKDELRTS